MEVPDYYKKHANKPIQPKTQPIRVAETDSSTELYYANTFTLNQLEDWRDETVYTLVGPVESGIRHNVLINVEQEVQFDSVYEYADWQIAALEDELKGCRLLKRAKKQLANGMEAYEAVFRWYPMDDLRIYQQQIFVLVDKTGYKLTATFTKRTRKTLGPKVERMMLSFQPRKKETAEDTERH